MIDLSLDLGITLYAHEAAMRTDTRIHASRRLDIESHSVSWKRAVAGLKPTARFVADCPALDFLNSRGRPHSDDCDWLGNGTRLLAWLGQARLVPAEVLARFQSEAEPADLQRVAADATELREWLRFFVDQHRQRTALSIDPAELRLLNGILSGDAQYCQVTASISAESLALQSLRLWMTPDSLLRPVAAAVAKLMCEVDFSHIKMCERCCLLFCDHTRGRARKWCSMSTCGNRTKQAAHRRRRKRPRR